ncbi:hypothetical protein DK842_18770 [Chromobacterium phragmitis]|uniref:Uncharacterized protein n=1 Tax=Chromobacterium phragmitis TaxID=2202141 RepID=A0A344UCY9_9NEIS|nr:hypothetical protein [Chromobacterium phragmitis]AXE31759.1 hypothetical protein DK842_18770 [Chromobacterium phragmitis]AXE33137.1 hypothetical protein DK843_01695 [Chromobacterium phragmitis]
MSTTAYYLLRRSVSGRKPLLADAGAHALRVQAAPPDNAPAAPGSIEITRQSQLQPAQAMQAPQPEKAVKTA